MNILRNLLIAAIAFYATATSAQRVDWDGVRFGYTKCEFNGNPLMNDLSGASIGYSSLTRLSRTIPVCIETGLYGDWVGKSDNGVKTNLIDLSLPINLGIKLNFTRDIALFPYFGTNFKAYILAQTKHEGSSSTTINYFNTDDMSGHPYERWHAGWHVGADLQLSRIVIGVNYGEDFTKFNPLSDKKMNTLQVRAGINL